MMLPTTTTTTTTTTTATTACQIFSWQRDGFLAQKEAYKITDSDNNKEDVVAVGFPGRRRLAQLNRLSVDGLAFNMLNEELEGSVGQHRLLSAAALSVCGTYEGSKDINEWGGLESQLSWNEIVDMEASRLGECVPKKKIETLHSINGNEEVATTKLPASKDVSVADRLRRNPYLVQSSSRSSLHSALIPGSSTVSNASIAPPHPKVSLGNTSQIEDGLFCGNRKEIASTECESSSNNSNNQFLTAREKLEIDQRKKQNNTGGSGGVQVRKTLGGRARTVSKFVSPVIRNDESGNGCSKDGGGTTAAASSSSGSTDIVNDGPLKGLDSKLIELIRNEIMDRGTVIDWDDIAGLGEVKTAIQELVVWPMLRPDLFNNLRKPSKGLMLFGPPGTGKTLIGKCIACKSGATFFNISASSLTSKWVGEGEKLVRALFAVARSEQPSVVFIDEIDSLLSKRSDTEHESSRRIKTEFLVQLDGAGTAEHERLLIVGATNRPQEIDDAARRRFEKRLYVPLPEADARGQIIRNLLSGQKNCLDETHIEHICSSTKGYSGADMATLCREAAFGPIRSVQDIRNVCIDDVRPIEHSDFIHAFGRVRASVSPDELGQYLKWNEIYGSVSYISPD